MTDRRAAADESSLRSDEQLDVFEELDAAEGFDGWDVFTPADDEQEEEAA